MARRVAFSEGDASRIGAAVRAHERGNRDMSPLAFRQVADETQRFALGKTTAAWNKGTLLTVQLYDKGTPPNETVTTPVPNTISNCVNKFANVGSAKWVILAQLGNGSWYLIAAEC